MQVWYKNVCSRYSLLLQKNMDNFNRHPMGFEAQLARKCLSTPTFFWWPIVDPQSRSDWPSRSCAIKVHKYRSVYARLQVSVYSGYDLFHLN